MALFGGRTFKRGMFSAMFAGDTTYTAFAEDILPVYLKFENIPTL